MRWPLRSALAAYRERLRKEARDEFRFAMLLWVIGGKDKAPKQPEILKDDDA